jgi:hypothetical protein
MRHAWDVMHDLPSLLTVAIGWFAYHYYRRPLLAVRELRRSAQQAFSRLPTLGVFEGRGRLRDLAAEADAIHKTLPYPLSIFLRRIGRCDLEPLFEAFNRLSNSLGKYDGKEHLYRVKIQRHLNLTPDPSDQKYFNSYHRLIENGIMENGEG